MQTPHEAIADLFAHVRAGLYSAHIDTGPDGITERTLTANPALLAMLGYEASMDPTAVRLFDTSRFIDPTARDLFLRTLLQEATSETVTDYPLQLRLPNGRTRWIEITARATGTAPTRIDAVVRDVGDRYEREERTRSLYRQLAESERQAAIGRTLAELSHELRNPLSTILAWAERLSLEPLDETTQRGVAEIQSASERAARIARNALHAVSRRQSTRAMVDVNEIIKETLALRQHEQRAVNVTVVTELMPALPHVLADAHQIQQVLLNLIINAEQALAGARRHGVLTVRTWLDDAGAMALVEVSDDGPGIDPAVRSRIFDPYFTTKETDGGTGLGLAVAQSLAREHGGGIRLAEPAGSGASFVVELPVSRRPTA